MASISIENLHFVATPAPKKTSYDIRKVRDNPGRPVPFSHLFSCWFNTIGENIKMILYPINWNIIQISIMERTFWIPIYFDSQNILFYWDNSKVTHHSCHPRSFRLVSDWTLEVFRHLFPDTWNTREMYIPSNHVSEKK